MNTKSILKVLNCKHLALYRGVGYWYFVYDDPTTLGSYHTYSVFVVHLKELTLDRWIEEGTEFLKTVLAEEEYRSLVFRKTL
jgi:hypothetical protein